ncbi:alpha/beta fold hydrolase [Candidatus Phaeomarinobacter ectocarpi]|nr:alpha/beta hydrolase [Candidatus Phaeomarinobacter ectocarpi]
MGRVMGTVLFLLVAVFGGLYVYTLWFGSQTEARFPPLGEFVEVEGTKLHYVDKGQGVPIVLVHGASGNLRDFATSILDDIARTHRVIAFDRPGHGWSERGPLEDVHDPAVQARLVNGALEKLGVGEHVILGHSWGGAVVMAYALNHPDDLIGLIPMSGATYPWQGGVAWYHGIVQTPVVGGFFLRTLMVPAGQQLKEPGVVGNFYPDVAPDNYSENIGLDLLFRPGNFRNNSVDVSNLKSALARQSERYSEVKVPTIIVHGGGDRSVGFGIHSEPLHDAIDGSELIRLRGTGHMPHYARPDIVLDAIDRLARGDAPQAGLRIVEEGQALAQVQ